MNEIAFSLDSIHKTFGQGSSSEVRVLQSVSLNVAKGEIIGLLAPSGAGKSTLLHIAGLLDVPDQGTIIIGEHNMNNASERLRTRMRRSEIGFVYQFHHLLPEFSAQENIMLPQLANGCSSEEAATCAIDLLTKVGLENRASHRPSELSGGEQQRVALCRALANQPSFILADEPTGNLDINTAEQVFETLLELVRNTGLSALIATHNYDLAARMDRSVRLENGQLRQVA